MSLYGFIKPTTITFLSREHVVANIYTFTFTLDAPFSWLAGQHGMIEARLANGKTGRRMFSLSSAPSEKVVSITTHWHGEEKASEYKKALWSMEPGSKAKLRGPVGPMHIQKSASEHVFLAGGIGITPFRAMIADVVNKNPNIKGTLLYANRSNSSIAFQDELEKLSSQLENFEVIFVVNPNTITAEMIEKSCSNLQDTTFYLAGPPAMVRSYKKLLKSLGVIRSHIKNDPFYGYK